MGNERKSMNRLNLKSEKKSARTFGRGIPGALKKVDRFVEIS